MANIANVFIDMVNKKNDWLKALKGSDFEDIFRHKLRNNGYYQLINQPKHVGFSQVKERVQEKLGTELLFLSDFGLENIGINGSYMMQPYGTQDYPDFVVFTNTLILPIETKYSKEKQSKPMWNGNLPKYNGIYVFASNGRKDVTFFTGNDVLPHNEREELVRYWEMVRHEAEKHTKRLKAKRETGEYKFNRGFNIYPRETYNQSRALNEKAQLDYFSAPNRGEIEASVIAFLKDIE